MNRSLAVFLFPTFFSLPFRFLFPLIPESSSSPSPSWRATLTSRLFLFRPSSFVREEEGVVGRFLERENRNGAVRDIQGFMIGSRCTGHDIKLSYAHLGIFYYHRGAKEHAFPTGDTPRCSSFFIFSPRPSPSPPSFFFSTILLPSYVDLFIFLTQSPPPPFPFPSPFFYFHQRFNMTGRNRKEEEGERDGERKISVSILN